MFESQLFWVQQVCVLVCIVLLALEWLLALWKPATFNQGVFQESLMDKIAIAGIVMLVITALCSLYFWWHVISVLMLF